jgi:hypothetical protein
MNWTVLLSFPGYFVVFFGALFGMVRLERWRRQTRKPFREDLRLLRMPGEYLWQRVIESDEDELRWWGATLVPIVVGAAMFHIAGWLFRSLPLVGLALASIVFIISLIVSVRWIQKRLQRRANDYLGFFGERYVAECLDPLKAEGWFIFHDVPCEGATGRFNLDHVAVGPNGIWVVETKTRRKGNARPGHKDFRVESDGTKIMWPWGDETDSLKQAGDNARWLHEWLEKMIGKAFEVSAVLAFPGYRVKELKLGAVRAANPKQITEVLTGLRKTPLHSSDIDLIRRQLEEKCRTVEY